MAKKIMHMLFTGQHASPFDINMAADAGYEVLIPYTGVSLTDVSDLVQDSIFSRPPAYYAHSGMFIGGRDVNLAAEMLEASTSAMVKPFEVSVFADPNGAYTTSAALVALIEKQLMDTGQKLEGCSVAVFGGGPVGMCAAVLVARQGARPTLARLTPGSPEKAAIVDSFLSRYGVTIEHIDAQDNTGKKDVLSSADVIISTAKAGIEVLSTELLASANNVKVAVDVNAVPPAGIAGVGMNDNGEPVEGMNQCVGIGALAIGNVKYKTQQGLLANMLEAPEALLIDFPEAFTLARKIVTT